MCRSVALLLVTLVAVSKASWIDPDTPEFYLTTKSMLTKDTREYELVFSDEFEQEGRTFHDGNDPRWTSIDKNDYTNAALHFYSEHNAKTEDGVLKIKTEKKVNSYRAFNETTKKYFADKKYVQSAMVQGWNKFCFTGGIIEFSAKLPGKPDVGGLWPALWMLGNLARATYVGSSDYMWPYSYNECDDDKRMSQKISACKEVNHYGMFPFTGRGAPEIDVIEAMQGIKEKLPNTNITRPYQSCSLQVAPGIENNRPVLGHLPQKGHWYSGMEYNNNNATRSEINPFFYGVKLEHERESYTYQADALSANIGLNKSYYTSQQTYRVEWDPPADDGSGGYIKWYTNNIFLYSIKGADLNITGSEIPSEAMYLIMNTAVASSWGFPAPCPSGCSCECYECGKAECACALPSGYCENFPASFEIDYVRVYQAKNESRHTVGCSPEKMPTDIYIKGHEKRYMEDGDRAPLRPISNGGAYCTSDSQCGGPIHGQCSDRGFCICGPESTGPSCLAHAAFYENESRSATTDEIGWAKMFIPHSLVILVVLVFAGFLASMLGALGDNTRKGRYQKVPNGTQEHSTGNAPASYQNSAEYALPPQQKVVTYCVIDGRLVDQ